MGIEHFVSADIAAEFTGINRRHLLSLARKGMAGCYPIGPGEFRKRWVFKLSELAAAIESQGNPPRMPPRKNNPPSNGNPPAAPDLILRRPVQRVDGYDQDIRRSPQK